MKYIPLLMALLVGNFIYCQDSREQRIYEFDYLADYELYSIEGKEDSIRKFYMMTNSKDNSYFSIIRQFSKDSLFIFFKDFDQVDSDFKVSKSDFTAYPLINIGCNYSNVNGFIQTEMRTANRTREKNWVIKIGKDSLIENRAYTNYIYSPVKVRRRNHVRKVIIETNTEFHLPVIQSHVIYEKWKQNDEKRKLNGIIRNERLFNGRGELLMELNLVRYLRFDKKMSIYVDCY